MCAKFWFNVSDICAVVIECIRKEQKCFETIRTKNNSILFLRCQRQQHWVKKIYHTTFISIFMIYAGGSRFPSVASLLHALLCKFALRPTYKVTYSGSRWQIPFIYWQQLALLLAFYGFQNIDQTFAFHANKINYVESRALHCKCAQTYINTLRNHNHTVHAQQTTAYTHTHTASGWIDECWR